MFIVEQYNQLKKRAMRTRARRAVGGRSVEDEDLRGEVVTSVKKMKEEIKINSKLKGGRGGKNKIIRAKDLSLGNIECCATSSVEDSIIRVISTLIIL